MSEKPLPKVCHLLADQQVTRRKRWHFVTDADGHTLWTGTRTSEAWEFIAVSQFTTVHLPVGSGTVVVQVDAFLPW